MIYVLVRFSVEDLAKWKAVFEEAAELRKNFGSMGVHAFNKADNSNEIVVLGEYSDKEKAMQMFQSQEFREATARGGVKGPPEVSFLNELVELPAYSVVYKKYHPESYIGSGWYFCLMRKAGLFRSQLNQNTFRDTPLSSVDHHGSPITSSVRRGNTGYPSGVR